MLVAHLGPKKKRADRSDVIISKTLNGEKVKSKIDSLKNESKADMKEFLAKDLPQPSKVENGVLFFNFKETDLQDWMVTSDLEGQYFNRSLYCPDFRNFPETRTSYNKKLKNSNFVFQTDGTTEFVFLRGVLSDEKFQRSLRILREIMIVDPTAKNVNGASGGAGGTPTKQDIELSLKYFECVGTKTSKKVNGAKITGKGTKVEYVNKEGRVCEFQFGPCLHRHVFGLKKDGDYIKDFANEVARRYLVWFGKNLSQQLIDEMEELLKKMKDIFVKYAGSMIVEENVCPADFFDKNIKMCLNFMSGTQKALYKDHRDPKSKFPCIMTALKSGKYGGGELFLRKFGFLADYKNGDVILLKGDQVPHSVNALVTLSCKKKKGNPQSKGGHANRGRIKKEGRLSLIFFNNSF